ncbi:hypothetical protein [Micromonospora avicenniae]|uniref:Uncharacterized protein n=1 Tax=Micromonospora avicenniae TaxID=1198245 RepID=A0A1N6ZC00_9ACTN|nr:hypothetical protein [Micromonospora avicenniae]SIR24343.1 hypothetical protein SAMN05444858_107270 [Micromonospora avicenniae]
MSLNGLGEPSGTQQPPTLFPVPEPVPPRPSRRRVPRPPEASGDSADSGAGTGDPGAGAAGADSGGGPTSVRAPARSQPVDVDEAGRQLVFFGAETVEPTVADLAGLLAGPGEVVRMGGTARLSMVVDAPWRVHVLVAELAQRGIAASWEPTEDERHAVRTSYTRMLKPLAVAWLRGATKRPPAGFHLNGRRLRLWLAAAGEVDLPGCRLSLGAADQECWDAVGRALAAVGLAGELLDPAAGGPAYLITGRTRLRRLAELVGERPPTAPPPTWP